MTNTRLFFVASLAAITTPACGSSGDRVCQPINAWSAAAFSCTTASKDDTARPDLDDAVARGDTGAGGEGSAGEAGEGSAGEAGEGDTGGEAAGEGDTGEAGEDSAGGAGEGEAAGEGDTGEAGEGDTEGETDGAIGLGEGEGDIGEDSAEQTVAIADGLLEIQGTLEFETRSARLTDEAQVTLDAVAKFLTDNPDIRKLRIDVRTDIGSRRASKKLAKKRAQAVRKYLIKQGVKKRRLQAKGNRKTARDGDAEGDIITFKILRRR